MTEQQAFLAFMHRALKEGGLILLLAACAFLLLALSGYDPRDPGWSHLGYSGVLRNPAGAAGAWLADFSYSLLGYGAFLVPLMVLYRVWRLFLQRDFSWTQLLPYLFLRFLGALFLLGAGAALLSLHFSNPLELPFASGGILGLNIAQQSLSLFGLLGATSLLFPAFLVGLTLFTEMSWFSIADRIGSVLIFSTQATRRLWDRLFSARPKPLRVGTATKQPDESLMPVASSAKLITEHARGRESGATNPSTDEAASERKEPQLTSIDGVAQADVLSPKPAPRLSDLDAVLDTLSDISDSALPPFVIDGAANERGENPGADKSDDVQQSSHERGLKIVPLSETHRSGFDHEFDDEPEHHSVSQRAERSLPRLALLDPPDAIKSQGYTAEQLESMSRLLEEKLKDFGVMAEVVEVNPGPVITRFEIQPAPGTKVSKITNLAKDLARSMAVLSVRVVEVIAGKSVVGIEIPNETREVVRLSEVLGSNAYDKASSRLSLGLGNDIAGNPVVVNLAKMPHLLVAGTTGSGKSVGVNAMLLSLLFKATPDEVRLMMVDPKMLELSIYDGIPHLLTPVITDMKEAATGLRWCVAEMERRYRLMAKMGVRNLAGFNDKLKEAAARGESIPDPLWNPEAEGEPIGTPAPALEPLPYIVVVIDEFADMMMIVGKKVEELIARIAQKARAAGIHLILATQRPSVDVITGLIKANVPTRIAFQVSSKIDSRTILDQGGAENLLGNGDMLYLPAGSSMPVRVHGAFVADDEVHRVVEDWKKWGPAEYIEEILMENVDADYTNSGSAVSGGLFEDEQDALYDEAVAFVIQSRRASISAVQRKLKIGYNRAARMIETMEAAGVVSEASHNGSREVLVPPPAGA